MRTPPCGLLSAGQTCLLTGRTAAEAYSQTPFAAAVFVSCV